MKVQARLPFRRIRVFPECATLTNSSVTAMNVEFRTLILGDFPCPFDCFLLGRIHSRSALRARSPDAPLSATWDDVLTFG